MVLNDLTGQQFYDLFVKERFGKPGEFKKTMWLCQCKCGNEVVVSGSNLKSGNTKSCGCNKFAERPRISVDNEIYGVLRAIKRVNTHDVLCECICGKQIIVSFNNLRSGNTQSCGCRLANFILNDMKNLTGRRFGELLVLARYIDAKQSAKTQKWLCLCSCGRYTIVDDQKLTSGHTQSCGCMKNSLPESIIVHYLRTHEISFEKEFKYKDLVSYTGLPLRFDFKIDTLDGYFLLEYQGQQHYLNHDDFGRQQREVTDKMKKEYCAKNNIELVEIRYDETLIESLEGIISFHDVLHDNPVPSLKRKV